MYSDKPTSGKHMICDIRGIKNSKLLNSLDNIRKVLDMICEKHEYSVLGRLEHQFDPHGITIIYLLSESHISVHTFPEKNYLALDIYTCREYPDNEVYLKIYEYLVEAFHANSETPTIIDRIF